MDTYKEYRDVMNRLTNNYYYQNPYDSRYLTNYIGRYIMKVLGGKPIYSTIRKVGYCYNRPDSSIDWTLDWKGKTLKIKHHSACLSERMNKNSNSLKWNYCINNNSNADAFVLSAFDTRDSLEPQFLWFIMSDEIIVGHGNGRPFWNRQVFNLHNDVKSIEMMKKYELSEHLKILKDVLKDDLSKNEDSYDKLRKSLYQLQNRIYMSTNKKISIEKLVEKTIEEGIKYI